MERVNRNYIAVPVSGFDLFIQMVAYDASNDVKKAEFFDKLIRTTLALKANSRKNFDTVYVCVDNRRFKRLGFDLMQIPVSRKSYSSARDMALEEGNIEMVRKMFPVQFADIIMPGNLPKEALDYILDNSVNEIKQGYFFDGEKVEYKDFTKTQEGNKTYKIGSFKPKN